MAEINDLAITAGNNTGRFPEGMAVASVNDSARELEAMLGRYTRDLCGANVASGSANAFQVNPYRSISALEAGLLVTWRAHVPCGTAPTLSVDGLAAKPLVDANDRQLTTGDIVAGQLVVSVYNASRDAWECVGIKNTMPRYAVASLPSAAVPGIAFATDGRKNGEGSGAGTGVMVFSDGTNWVACDTGATVAA